jgi:hypothetical protein
VVKEIPRYPHFAFTYSGEFFWFLHIYPPTTQYFDVLSCCHTPYFIAPTFITPFITSFINILTTDIPIFYILLQYVFYSDFSIHDVAYVQFHQDYIGLPEDGAPAAPKHVAAR